MPLQCETAQSENFGEGDTRVCVLSFTAARAITRYHFRFSDTGTNEERSTSHPYEPANLLKTTAGCRPTHFLSKDEGVRKVPSIIVLANLHNKAYSNEVNDPVKEQTSEPERERERERERQRQRQRQRD